MKTQEFEGREYAVAGEGLDGRKILLNSEEIILVDENGNKVDTSDIDIKAK